MLEFCVITWALLCLWAFWHSRRPRIASVGLPLAYVTLLTIVHCGAAIYLLPWYDPTTDPYLAQAGVTREDTIRGFAASTLGLAAFCLGVWLRDQLPGAGGGPREAISGNAARMGRNLLLVGAISYFVVSRLRWIPGSASTSTAGASLAVVGLCLLLQSARGGFARSRVMAGALAFPLITTVSAGFIGFGVTAMIQAGSFFVRHLRIRWWYFALAPFVLWSGLSLYITYMGARNDIRAQVWGGSSLSARVESVAHAFANPQRFDPSNSEHLYPIDGRLNQNALVGRAIQFMKLTHMEHAYGRTLALAAIAWIPRILWPGKPAFGGSRGIVSEYSGMSYDATTSVGVGNVLELYINFGIPGISLGFLVFGLVLRHGDLRAAKALRSGRLPDYVFFHLIGISALQPGGMWAEVVGACAAAALLVSVLKRTGIIGAIAGKRAGRGPSAVRRLRARPLISANDY